MSTEFRYLYLNIHKLQFIFIFNKLQLFPSSSKSIEFDEMG